jgi:hypothetical protein
MACRADCPTYQLLKDQSSVGLGAEDEVKQGFAEDEAEGLFLYPGRDRDVLLGGL